METKIAKVLTHLKEHKTITSWEAIQLYGATRLSAIIYNLRHKGYQIENIWQQGEDRCGNTCRYVMYELRGEKNEDIANVQTQN